MTGTYWWATGWVVIGKVMVLHWVLVGDRVGGDWEGDGVTLGTGGSGGW